MGDIDVVNITAGLKRKDSLPSEKRILLASDPRGRGDQFATALGNARYVVRQAGAMEDLLQMAGRTEPDVVVLGNDRSCNLIRLVAQVTGLAPQAAVVVLFEKPDEAELLAVIHAGALGYLPVTIPPQRLSAAIQALLDGEPAVPRSMTATLVRQLRSPGCITLRTGDGRVIKLSAREWDTLCLLQQGYCTNEIAEGLFVSAATVRSHVSAIEHKLDVTDRDAALSAVFSR